jgi:predicted membrane channel-forming protein YqfA (hemolysin III family)
MPHKRQPFGFYVVLVFVGVFVSIAVADRLQSGTWGACVGILCMVVMGFALFVASSVCYSLESAYYRWKSKRQKPGDWKP